MRDTAAPLKARHIPKNKHRAEGRNTGRSIDNSDLFHAAVYADAFGLKLCGSSYTWLIVLQHFGSSSSVQAFRFKPHVIDRNLWNRGAKSPKIEPKWWQNAPKTRPGRQSGPKLAQDRILDRLWTYFGDISGLFWAIFWSFFASVFRRRFLHRFWAILTVRFDQNYMLIKNRVRITS